MTANDPTDAEIALSLQRALLGAVSARLRAVGFLRSGNEIVVTFVFDGEASGDDVESAQIVTTEVISDFPAPELQCLEHVLRVDSPLPVPHPQLGRLVFLRKEAP
jgi:hypothetical protein